MNRQQYYLKSYPVQLVDGNRNRFYTLTFSRAWIPLGFTCRTSAVFGLQAFNARDKVRIPNPNGNPGYLYEDKLGFLGLDSLPALNTVVDIRALEIPSGSYTMQFEGVAAGGGEDPIVTFYFLEPF